MQHYPPPKLYKIPFLDAWGKQQQWISSVESQHDLWCGCHHWFAHFLDSVVPLDSRNRGKTIQEIIEQSTHQLRALPALPLKPWPGDTTGDEKDPSEDAGKEEPQNTENQDFTDVMPEDELAEILENAARDENVPGWFRKIRHTPQKKKARRPTVPGRKRQLHYPEPTRDLPSAARNIRRPRAAAPQPQRAATQQKHQPLKITCNVKTKTITNATSHGYDGVSMFHRSPKQPKKFEGWGAIIEKEVAQAFHRPPRTYTQDTPIYPWLPIVPKVSFALRFKN
ncbi:hypothetical protein [Torque teno midi virus 15]|uniref:Hepatitis TT virus Orf2/Gyrovirus Vp2 N-terminal domain-containing protein n=2 Tax=Torque teno midi virus 15 TaxID=2065056 RepID=B6ZK26_9VIRU|nr:hypothetical protein [Torque teno midi virus 15]BAG84578.1 hypothetical protein [Torque teno midi virus 15]